MADYFVRALEKGLKVLEAFNNQTKPMRLVDVAKMTDMSLPMANRYIRTLTQLGYLHKNLEGKTFCLTPKIISMGFSVLNNMDFRTRLHPFMQEVNTKFCVNVNLSILEDTNVLFVSRINGPNLSNLDHRVGTKLPAFCTSMGRCFLAFLPPHLFEEYWKNIKPELFTSYTITDKHILMKELEKTKNRGFAISKQEMNLGWQSISVPIFEGSNVLAAFGVSFNIDVLNDQETIQLIVHALLDISKKNSILSEMSAIDI